MVLVRLILLSGVFLSLLDPVASAAQINVVQHGKVIFGENDLERTYILAQPVNPDQSWVSVQCLSKSDDVTEAALKVAADFVDHRTVRVVRQQKGIGIEVALQVAEFKSGLRVRRGVTEFPQDVYQMEIAISKTDTKNSMVLLDVTAENYPEDARPHLFFISKFHHAHSLAITRTDARIPNPEKKDEEKKEAKQEDAEEAREENEVEQDQSRLEEEDIDPAEKEKKDYLRLPMPRALVYWQLLEFDSGAKIQKGVAKMPDFATDTNAYFSDALKPAGRSFFHYLWKAGQGILARRDLLMLRAEFYEDNQIVFKRAETNEERHTDLEIQWNVVELMSASNQVQTGVAYVGAGAKEQRIKIAQVNPSRALILLQVVGGKNSGNFPEGEQAASFSFISEFGAEDQIVLSRGGSAIDAEVGWTVVEFAPITIQAPQGEEVFRVGETIEVRWDSSADMLTQGPGEKGVQLVDIQISFEDGHDEFKHTIAKGLPITKSGFKWLIPDIVNDKSVISRETRVRIVVPALPGKNMDETRTPFQIKGVIQIISPNGGERWYVGETERKIEWEYKGWLGVLSIYYDRESGYGFDPFPRSQRIARVVPGKKGKGSFTWNPIPDLSLTRAKIKIVSETDESVHSISYNDFAIVPRIELQISAKDAESYQAGRFLDLKWLTTGTIDFFSLYYQTDMYANWKLAQEKIPGGAAGNYSFRWLVPAEAESDTLRLKIAKTSDMQVFDTGPDDLGGYITVRPWIQMSDPTENDVPVWRTGEKQVIEWDFGGNVEYLNLEYSLDDGSTWIKDAVLDARIRRHEWVVPDLNSTEFRIRLSDVSRPSLNSSSQVPFEVNDFAD